MGKKKKRKRLMLDRANVCAHKNCSTVKLLNWQGFTLGQKNKICLSRG